MFPKQNVLGIIKTITNDIIVIFRRLLAARRRFSHERNDFVCAEKFQRDYWF